MRHKHKPHFVFVLHKHKINFGNAQLAQLWQSYTGVWARLFTQIHVCKKSTKILSVQKNQTLLDQKSSFFQDVQLSHNPLSFQITLKWKLHRNHGLNDFALTNISPWRLCLRPLDHNCWKAETLSFLHVLLVCGVILVSSTTKLHWIWRYGFVRLWSSIPNYTWW